MALLDGLAILYLEDDRDTREVMMLGLRRHGAQLFGTYSAQIALLLFEQHQPDVVIADLELADPELDGWTFMRAVREMEQEKRTPAIAVSVHNEPTDRLKSLSAGFTLHVAKPVTPDELAGRIALLVQPVPGTEHGVRDGAPVARPRAPLPADPHSHPALVRLGRAPARA
jgi:CheY-like chemotaxis protein